jgi:F-type H+-transporting ATPase subunit delta
MMKKLDAKQYAQSLFSKNKNFLKKLRISKETSPLAIVSMANLTVLKLLPSIIKAVSKAESSQFLEQVLEEYERMLKRWYLGKDTAYIKTAVPLTLEEEEELNEKLAKIFGRYLRLDIEVDPNLIGGIIIKVDDKIIDRSVLGKLKGLEKHIES